MGCKQFILHSNSTYVTEAVDKLKLMLANIGTAVEKVILFTGEFEQNEMLKTERELANA